MNMIKKETYKKIKLKWFYFILSNLLGLWPIKPDFGLTTLATRKKSQSFPQYIAAEKALAACLRFPLTVLLIFVEYVCLSNKRKKGETKGSPETFSQ